MVGDNIAVRKVVITVGEEDLGSVVIGQNDSVVLVHSVEADLLVVITIVVYYVKKSTEKGRKDCQKRKVLW